MTIAPTGGAFHWPPITPATPRQGPPVTPRCAPLPTEPGRHVDHTLCRFDGRPGCPADPDVDDAGPCLCGIR